MTQLTRRERTLATLVGGTVLVVLNLFLLNFFLKNQRALKEDFAAKESQLEVMQSLFGERELWEQRDAWVQAHQPKLTGETQAGAGNKLLNEVLAVAKQHTVGIENQQLGAVEKRPHATAVLVTLETKSTWPALVAFLRDMQGAEKFVVFEMANMQVDAADKTQMRGRFRIARWFAPK